MRISDVIGARQTGQAERPLLHPTQRHMWPQGTIAYSRRASMQMTHASASSEVSGASGSSGRSDALGMRHRSHWSRMLLRVNPGAAPPELCWIPSTSVRASSALTPAATRAAVNSAATAAGVFTGRRDTAGSTEDRPRFHRQSRTFDIPPTLVRENFLLSSSMCSGGPVPAPP
eukprot:Amastigsp_a693192_6.p1 type:complete len:173 gc:universal Amastigsp_a693192_6:210-728(+)